MSVNRSFPPFVYFVRQTDGGGPVKIGCSQLPEGRLSALMTWAPYPLEIVAKLPGDETLERRFHAKFAGSHTHREWFRPSAELTLTIAQIQAGLFDIDSLPPPKLVTGSSVRPPVSENTRRGMSWKHRLRHLSNRGVNIPEEVQYAAYRWSAGRYFRDFNPHNPEDARIVEAFLAAHPPRKQAA